MIHLGDITKINGAEIPVVDVITGGSPCQDLSVAGKRAGLAGERSGLYMEQIRIVKEMREHDRNTGRADEYLRPRYMVLENVPGALSSGDPKGEDFRIVLEEAARVADPNASVPRPEKWTNAGCIVGNGYSIAWKIHDAQWWSVPQRRRRICMLCDFNGYSAADILFDAQYRRTSEGADAVQAVGDPGGESRSEVPSFSEGLSRDTDTCIQEGQGPSGDTEDCFGESDT